MLFFFFNDTTTTYIYTLSLHDALPISRNAASCRHGSCPTSAPSRRSCGLARAGAGRPAYGTSRSEEHTSELQSQSNLVCRLLLEKKKRSVENHHILNDKE